MIGHHITGILGVRLDQTRVTAISDLPGIVVYTKNGPYYAELWRVSAEEPISREEITEGTHGLVDLVTKKMSIKNKSFKVLTELKRKDH